MSASPTVSASHNASIGTSAPFAGSTASSATSAFASARLQNARDAGGAGAPSSFTSRRITAMAKSHGGRLYGIVRTCHSLNAPRPAVANALKRSMRRTESSIQRPRAKRRRAGSRWPTVSKRYATRPSPASNSAVRKRSGRVTFSPTTVSHSAVTSSRSRPPRGNDSLAPAGTTRLPRT